MKAALNAPLKMRHVMASPITTMFTHPDGKIPTLHLPTRTNDGKADGYRHCMYVLPLATYTDSEREQLVAFVRNQDNERRAASPLVGGFPGYLARIAKHGKSSEAYARGYRWRYTTGRSSTFRYKNFKSLHDLMRTLAMERIP